MGAPAGVMARGPTTGASPPEGFERYGGARGFGVVLGPLWVRVDPAVTFAVTPTRRRCNGQAVVHGGYLSTFADVALVHGAARAMASDAMFVTASLAIDFLSPCRAGAWLFCQPEVLKTGARAAVACARLWTKDEPVAFARASIVRVRAPSA